MLGNYLHIDFFLFILKIFAFEYVERIALKTFMSTLLSDCVTGFFRFLLSVANLLIWFDGLISIIMWCGSESSGEVSRREGH